MFEEEISISFTEKDVKIVIDNKNNTFDLSDDRLIEKIYQFIVTYSYEWESYTIPCDIYGKEEKTCLLLSKNSEFLEEYLSYLEDTDKNFYWNYEDQYVWSEAEDTYYYKDDNEYLSLENGDIIGKWTIENDFNSDVQEDILENFLNNPKKALAMFVEDEVFEKMGFEKRSCDFKNGWYGKEDDPIEILENLQQHGLDVLFQIDGFNPYEIEFCVWTRVKK